MSVLRRSCTQPGHGRARQRGATAVLVAICLVMLCALPRARAQRRAPVLGPRRAPERGGLRRAGRGDRAERHPSPGSPAREAKAGDYTARHYHRHGDGRGRGDGRARPVGDPEHRLRCAISKASRVPTVTASASSTKSAASAALLINAVRVVTARTGARELARRRRRRAVRERHHRAERRRRSLHRSRRGGRRDGGTLQPGLPDLPIVLRAGCVRQARRPALRRSTDLLRRSQPGAAGLRRAHRPRDRPYPDRTGFHQQRAAVCDVLEGTCRRDHHSART